MTTFSGLVNANLKENRRYGVKVVVRIRVRVRVRISVRLRVGLTVAKAEVLKF